MNDETKEKINTITESQIEVKSKLQQSLSVINGMNSSVLSGIQKSQPILANLNSALTHLFQWINELKQIITANAVDTILTISDTIKKSIIDTGIVSSIYTFAQDCLSPLFEKLKELSDNLPEYEKFKARYDYFMKEMMKYKWFPFAGEIAPVEFLASVFNVFDTTKNGKQRQRELDRLVFNHYNKTEIENIRKSWRGKCEKSCYITVMNQAVRAYYRKEYALVVCTLTSLWEGIIAQKAKIKLGRRDSKIKEGVNSLIQVNGFEPIYKQFCDEFIFYDCRSDEQAICDVPGRHSIAHGFYNKCPNMKAALNSILFTDFLLSVTEINDEEIVNG